MMRYGLRDKPMGITTRMLPLFVCQELNNTLGANQSSLNRWLHTALLQVELVLFVSKGLDIPLRSDTAQATTQGMVRCHSV